MDSLFQKQRILLANLNLLFKRDILNQISWSDRLIGIKGARGVGKTNMILQHIKEKCGASTECLYVSMDDIEFPYRNLIELAGKFYQLGGKQLFIDEVHKQENWIVQLKNIYDQYPGLQIVFSGSSILELDHSKADLSRRAVIYTIRGLSFREFLQIETKSSLKKYTLQEIIENHEEISFEIIQKLKPLKYFKEYLKYGYYPFYLQNTETYPIKLSELINQIIEFDLRYLANIDIEHYVKLKRFLYLLSQYVPVKPNISNLSARMGMSRATIINYIHYLEKADILTILYPAEKTLKSLSKPEKVLLHHPNIYFALSSDKSNKGSVRETFFVNQLIHNHDITTLKKGDFMVDKKYTFEIGGKNKSFKQIANIENSYVLADEIEIGYKNKIPLWLMGFLY